MSEFVDAFLQFVILLMCLCSALAWPQMVPGQFQGQVPLQQGKTIEIRAGLPDGIFSNPKSQFG
jgi:DNA-binding transcriptional regulator of glucitol operon